MEESSMRSKKVNEPIRQRSLPGVRIEGMLEIGWVWISTEMWTFIIDHLTPDVARMAPSLCNGEEMNGLELWRTFFRNNEGGAEEVEQVDIDALSHV